MKMWMMFDFLYHPMRYNRNVLIRVTAYNCFAINCHILYVKCSHNSLLFGILESLSHTSICEHNYLYVICVLIYWMVGCENS